MKWIFHSTLIYWRGPAPWYFLIVPDECGVTIKVLSTRLSYGWGVIPVRVYFGDISFTTSLIPKDGNYLLPLRAEVRKQFDLAEGDQVTVELEVDI